MAESHPIAANDDALLIDWLKERDAACPLCNYNIRGLDTPRCPECGQGLRLSVSLAEPYLKAWIALVAGLLPPAGIGSIILIAICYMMSPQGPRGFSLQLNFLPIGFAFASVHVMVSVPLSVLAIVFRRRFMGWRKSVQIALASAAWIAVVVSSSIVLSQILR